MPQPQPFNGHLSGDCGAVPHTPSVDPLNTCSCTKVRSLHASLDTPRDNNAGAAAGILHMIWLRVLGQLLRVRCFMHLGHVAWSQSMRPAALECCLSDWSRQWMAEDVP